MKLTANQMAVRIKHLNQRIDQLVRDLKPLRRNRYLAEVRRQKIESLLKQLAVEKRLNHAMSQLVYAPPAKQPVRALKNLQKATKIREKLAA